MPCFYCLCDKTSISICMDCKARLESAERELKDIKKQIEIRRQQYFQKLNEYRRNVKRNIK